MCPFGSNILGQMIRSICFQKLAHEKVSLAGKFGGFKPIPEDTITLWCSVVRILIFSSLCVIWCWFQLRGTMAKDKAKQFASMGNKFSEFLKAIQHQGKLVQFHNVMLEQRRTWGEMWFQRMFLVVLPASKFSETMYYYQLALQSALILVVNKYEQSSKYNREWTEANEAWFKRQANSIHYLKAGCLRSGWAWINAICPYTTTEFSSKSTSGTPAHTKACHLHLTREWPDLWHDFNFTSFE